MGEGDGPPGGGAEVESSLGVLRGRGQVIAGCWLVPGCGRPRVSDRKALDGIELEHQREVPGPPAESA